MKLFYFMLLEQKNKYCYKAEYWTLIYFANLKALYILNLVTGDKMIKIKKNTKIKYKNHPKHLPLEFTRCKLQRNVFC